MDLLNQLDTHLALLDLAAEHPDIPKLQAKAKEARSFLSAAMLPNAEFSSMVIDYIARHGL
jgi:hypothetical protein